MSESALHEHFRSQLVRMYYRRHLYFFQQAAFFLDGSTLKHLGDFNFAIISISIHAKLSQILQLVCPTLYFA